MHSSAVVIKACALKEGQSIQPSASTSHQASAKNDSPGPGGLLAPPRASERASEQQAAVAQECVITVQMTGLS